MVQGGAGLPGGRLQLRRQPPDPGPGDRLPAAERHLREQSGGGAAEGGQHVLHD